MQNGPPTTQTHLNYAPTPMKQEYQPHDNNSSAKKTRFFVQRVQSYSQRQTSSQMPPMPVNIDNGFPNLTLHLGTPPNGQVELTGLFDTCGSLNTGLLVFHVYVASQYPDAVESLRFFDSNDPFEPIKLEGAVSDPSDYDASRHGLLTAVIRYKTPYKTTAGQNVAISIALGTDVSTNTIFGLPTLSAFEFVLDLKTLSAFSPTVMETFQLTRSAGRLGLPASVQFDLDDIRRQYEAAKVGEKVHDNNEGLDIAAVTFASPVGVIDDFSQGYLRRTVVNPTIHSE
jgi:hypothetical protein